MQTCAVPTCSAPTFAVQTCAVPTFAVQTYRNSPSPKPASFRMKATSSAGKKALALDGAPIIVKLLIPSDAKRSNSTGRKCRANKARILDLQDRQGNSLPPDTTAYSSFDPDFTYKKGETVHVEDFDTNRWNECAPGIHFFITRIEAVKY